MTQNTNTRTNPLPATRAQQIVTRLTWLEVDSDSAPDKRRVMRGLREPIQMALRRRDFAVAAERAQHAIDIARMWGEDLS